MLLSSVLILSLLLPWQQQSVGRLFQRDHLSSRGCLPSLPPWFFRKPTRRILHTQKTRSARGTPYT